MGQYFFAAIVVPGQLTRNRSGLDGHDVRKYDYVWDCEQGKLLEVSRAGRKVAQLGQDWQSHRVTRETAENEKLQT